MLMTWRWRTSKLAYFFCSEAQPKKTAIRKLIQPESISTEPFEDYTLIKTNNHEFLFKGNMPHSLLYVHHSDTPANLLKREALHIMVHNLPDINRREKYAALYKKLEARYERAYDKCTLPKQIFHMERLVKSSIRRSLGFVGVVEARYKHFMVFQSLYELNKIKTISEYAKKGVQIEAINSRIFSNGEVWLPTNEQYLQQFKTFLERQSNSKVESCLDIGSGSGVLSYMLSKQFKKAKIVGIDNNRDAVKTFTLNATSLKLPNATCLQFDVKNAKDFDISARDADCPLKYDWVVANPPWLIAKRLPQQGPIADGIYDEDGKMLASCFALAKSCLRDKKSKFLLIYSDLSRILGLEQKSVEDLCHQYNFIIVSREQRPMPNGLLKKSPLNQFKSQAKHQFFVIQAA